MAKDLSRAIAKLQERGFSFGSAEQVVELATRLAAWKKSHAQEDQLSLSSRERFTNFVTARERNAAGQFEPAGTGPVSVVDAIAAYGPQAAPKKKRKGKLKPPVASDLVAE